MATKKWRPRICLKCGDVVKVYKILDWFERFPFLSKEINWCRTCQRRLGIGDWIFGER